MNSGERKSRGSHGLSKFIGKWVYEPVQRCFSSQPSGRQSSGVTPAASEGATIGLGVAQDNYSTVVLADGAELAYEILGSQHLGRVTPIVMVCGMTAIRSDNERVTGTLARAYPVLVYEHRGMGDSSLSANGDEEITIETMARDLLFLLTKLRWKKIVLCGHSMGGAIAQQLLVFPYHPTTPVNLPFQITHLLLIAARCKPAEGSGLPIQYVPGKPRSLEERKEGAKRVIAATLDPEWIKTNSERFNYLLQRAVDNNLSNRPAAIIGESMFLIAKQGVATRTFYFEGLLDRIPRETQVLIIHGQLDQVIPTSCRDDIIKRISWAKLVEEGPLSSHVPTLKFGHLWYEYFDSQVWYDVLHTFVRCRGAS